ncbi:MAG: hypothetical protein COW73_05305 [Nitrospirae bacterium CG18_big_fil_WC_8_21_14_2_50_70_55]|nr:hypothetical protein [Deltaproteobacteria bacterium]OIP67395.1 MAG: hypothetical protein AUK30_00745 [Nitrospirae bacterium CG2_30_70_394]PIQ05631.1 MAG: hypothetical protein COW73_05305 [Nitrospirae bacterium CG18_big_fil_WC_8_21_14_2_50_70_55]PIU79739.1 MAG: hypothetical protein COS73_03060 [Nitrospirae bacterium CG06_land_8_20_14_3_00_70_43]PIW83424.1 MAG: hypothetical protein COZ96_03340 [Nitrospirae bacterium CG_4_8_14_3_um_filter_70_85]PIX83765.1 MAG: hypothetical protein COZ33_03730 
MWIRGVVLMVGCLALCGPVVADAEEEDGVHRTAPSTGGPVALSPDLRSLLQREMGAIQAGMQELVAVIAAGQWPRAAQIAKQIEASYVLRQGLSEAQVDELHRLLPPDFLEMDQVFHQRAGRLARAAETGNGEVAVFYFYKLTEGCVACHDRFAGQRSPGPSAAPHDHHH